jgi:CrcB protein
MTADRVVPGHVRGEHPLTVLAVIALGGALGALARYGVAVGLPHARTGWPWATFIENASGCFLIGVLMVVITEVVRPHPLVRPFLGVGVLGGYTTFSAYALEVLVLVEVGRPGLALSYLVATPLVAVAAAAIGSTGTRRTVAAVSLRQRRERP